MASSASQVEQRHRLENEVAALQRQLTTAESALSQHQHRLRSQEEVEAAASGQVAMLRQQADGVLADNAALEGQCAQQAADMKQLQNDVQVSCICNRPSYLAMSIGTLAKTDAAYSSIWP